MNIKAEAGETIFQLVERAIEIAKRRDFGVTITLDDITVCVYPKSYLHDIVEKMHYLREFCRLNNKH